MKTQPAYLLLALAFFAACTHKKTAEKTTSQGNTEQIPVNAGEDNGNMLKDASLAGKRDVVKAFMFSDRKTADTFRLAVEAGPIAKTQAVISIVNTAGKLIYEQHFPTRQLINTYELYTPPTAPNDLTPEEYSKYAEHFRNSISKAQYEHYVENKIRAFFNDVILSGEIMQSIWEMGDGNAAEKDLYEELKQQDNPVILCFPIHQGDQGSTYIGYSAKKGKAMVFSSVQADPE